MDDSKQVEEQQEMELESGDIIPECAESLSNIHQLNEEAGTIIDNMTHHIEYIMTNIHSVLYGKLDQVRRMLELSCANDVEAIESAALHAQRIAKQLRDAQSLISQFAIAADVE
jgi:5-methylthioribose kinase